MNSYVITLAGGLFNHEQLKQVVVDAAAENALSACEAARTLISTFSHHAYLSVQWRIVTNAGDRADLEIAYRDDQGRSCHRTFGRCERRSESPLQAFGTGIHPVLIPNLKFETGEETYGTYVEKAQ